PHQFVLFFPDPPPTDIYTLSLHDALPILSGQASDHESWDDVAADYQDQHQLVLIDYRGTGKSDMPTSPPYSTRLFAQDVVAVLRSEEHTSELQSLRHLVCRLLLEKKKKKT